MSLSWIARAQCAAEHVPLEWFFDERQAHPHALEVCARCPVRRECDEYARKTHSVGVWGGSARNLRHL